MEGSAQRARNDGKREKERKQEAFRLAEDTQRPSHTLCARPTNDTTETRKTDLQNSLDSSAPSSRRVTSSQKSRNWTTAGFRVWAGQTEAHTDVSASSEKTEPPLAATVVHVVVGNATCVSHHRRDRMTRVLLVKILSQQFEKYLFCAPKKHLVRKGF